jgi:hypothetical protein
MAMGGLTPRHGRAKTYKNVRENGPAGDAIKALWHAEKKSDTIFF